jgi:Zn-dependent M28 family amino/carboxypeptidase
MRIATSLVALASALALASGAAAQTLPLFDAERLSDHARILSADDFQGRGIATPAEQMVVDYLSRAYADAGFEPGGELQSDGSRSWTQSVGLSRFLVSNPQGSLTVGDWSETLVQGENIVMSTRLPGPQSNGSSQVTLTDKPLVFVGYGIDAPERNWDDFKNVDVRGKVIVVLVNDADFDDPALNTFGGRAMTYYGRWTYKYEEAARQGAAGILIVHEDAPASYGWGTVRNSWTGPQFDIVRANPTSERVPVEAWISRDLAVRMFQQAGLDFESLRVQARSRDFQPVILPGASFSSRYDLSTSQIQTRNIVARLPGATHPQETVLFTGHWDHIGVGAPDANGDAIFNGAVDNATGQAGLLELARAFSSAPRTRRSIVMISFTAEESGLLGSEYYAANPLYPLETTAGGINIDSANIYGRTNGFNIVGFGQSELDERLTSVIQAQGRQVSPDEGASAGIYFRSDHFPLAKRGVPMAYGASAGDFRDEPIAFRIAEREDYRTRRYHQADDEWSPDWDYRGQIEDLQVYYSVGRALADSADWPEWKPGSEFGSARTPSADARKQD